MPPLRGSDIDILAFRGFRSRLWRSRNPRLCYAAPTGLSWASPTIMSPLRGSDIKSLPSVGFVHAFGVHATHGCVMPPLRGFRGLRPQLCPRVTTHSCVMSPLRGSLTTNHYSSVFSATSIGFDISPYGCTATIQKTTSDNASGLDT